MAKPIPDKVLEQWRELAESIGPSSAVRAVVVALLDEIELERALLRRVRNYSIVSFGSTELTRSEANQLEDDIDAALEGT